MSNAPIMQNIIDGITTGGTSVEFLPRIDSFRIGASWTSRIPPLHELIKMIGGLRVLAQRARSRGESQANECNWAIACKMEMLTILIRGVADVDTQAALHWAALEGLSDIVKLLQQFGANVNKRDHLGNTPLHIAGHSVPVMKTLLSLGANPNKRDKQGKQPRDLEISPKTKRLLEDGMYVFNHCRFCDVEGGKLKTCAGCMHARYCSAECQKLDWPDHKKNCM